MAKDLSRRVKLSRRQTKSCNASPYRIPSLELFSHMSMEAAQAINETRQEMKEPKECADDNLHVKVSGGEATDEEEPVVCQVHKSEDHDSAIGTSSLRSTPITTVDDSSLAQQGSSSTCKKQRQRPVTVCALPTDTQSHGRQRPTHTSLSTSHLLDECLRKHAQAARPPADVKKLNVFERLSAPAPISYKPTARQRTRARLSLTLSLNNNKKHLLAFGQRIEPGIRCDSLTSAFPTVLRGQNQKASTNHKKEHGKTATPSLCARLTKNKPEHVHKAGTKLVPEDDKQRAVGQVEEGSMKSAERHPMHTSRQFEITPLGYDSRYMTIKYDHALYSGADFDEEVMLEESKLKCQQWLAYQTSLLANR